MNCSIAEPMFGDSRKYFILELDSDTVKMVKINHVKKTIPVKKLVDPLNGNSLKVKIPFRYNRVMCKVTGNKTIQEMVKGDQVQAEIKYCGWWESGDFGGPSWKLVSISSAN